MGFDGLPPTLQAKLKVGRPRAVDPKTVVTLRLRASVLAAYEAQGEDWRARMETVLVEALGSKGQGKHPEPDSPPASVPRERI